MTVEVINWQAGGGGIKPVKLFTDTLLAPDQPQAVGDLWNTTFYLTTATGTAGVTISSALNRSASGLVFANASGAGYVPQALSLPTPLTYSYVSVRNQFAQVTFVSNVGNANLGLILYCIQNSVAMYEMDLTIPPTQATLIRRSAGGNTVLIAPSAATAFANGDIMRLEGVITTPGQTTLTMKKNGVSIGSVVDNSAQRYNVGMPGLYFGGTDPAGPQMIIRDFSCGVL
jgi:hypothetical protein